jgi:putative oxidoreductase
MKKALANWQGQVYTALRIASGFMFLWHGLQKLFGAFAPNAVDFSAKPQIWIGGVIELVCGVAIALGLFTRWAALLASGTMAVAYFQFHFAGHFSEGRWLPIVNKGELAALYAFAFLFIATHGPGPLSLDRALRRDE